MTDLLFVSLKCLGCTFCHDIQKKWMPSQRFSQTKDDMRKKIGETFAYCHQITLDMHT